MSTLRKKIEEIQEKAVRQHCVCYVNGGKACSFCKAEISQATNAILQAVREIVPEKKEELEYTPRYGINEAYNAGHIVGENNIIDHILNKIRGANEIEDKVISLELAKEIDKEHKRLSLEVESEWWWVLYEKNKVFQLVNAKDALNSFMRVKVKKKLAIPAYDTSELGEILCKVDMGIPRYFSEYKEAWRAWLEQTTITEATEIECRGKMYLWLLKEGYIKGEDE